ncbi:MAG: hypothetical protein ACOC0T_04480 [Desulfovermiculus sp.]
MPPSWLKNKEHEFLTEIFRNFCLVHQRLLQECISQQNEQCVRFDCLDELIGQETNQGRLWRLKDTAHLLFRSYPDTPLIGRSLDWSLGYLFHECMKLKEDAYQLTKYVPWFESIAPEKNLPSNEHSLGQDLKVIASQTAESIDREVRRIQAVLSLCRKLFIAYLPSHRDNTLLARFIYVNMSRVRSVFGSQTDILLNAVYGPKQDDLVRLAAQNLRQGGWIHDANQALQTLAGEPE